MPILGERFYQMSNAIFCYDLKPIPLAVYSYLVCCAGQKELTCGIPQILRQRCGLAIGIASLFSVYADYNTV